MDLTRREATPDDLPALEIVRRQAIEHGFTGSYERADVADRVAPASDALPDRIDSEGHLVVVIESEVTLLSYGVYHRPGGRVRGIYTAPAYQREGWGTRVLDRFVEAARRSGEATIEATVPHGAVPFFEANGFEAIGRVREGGIEVTEMRRVLSGPQA